MNRFALGLINCCTIFTLCVCFFLGFFSLGEYFSCRLFKSRLWLLPIIGIPVFDSAWKHIHRSRRRRDSPINEVLFESQASVKGRNVALLLFVYFFKNRTPIGRLSNYVVDEGFTCSNNGYLFWYCKAEQLVY